MIMTLLVGLAACIPVPGEKCSFLREYGIGLKCPRHWRMQEVGVDSPLLLNSFELVNLYPIIDEARQGDATVKVLVESLPKAMSLDEFYKDVALKKLEFYNTDRLGIYGNKILKKSNFIFVDGGKGYQIVYSRFDGENYVKGMVFFRLRVEPKDTKAYIIYYTAKMDKYHELFDLDLEVEDFAKSMQLLID